MKNLQRLITGMSTKKLLICTFMAALTFGSTAFAFNTTKREGRIFTGICIHNIEASYTDAISMVPIGRDEDGVMKFKRNSGYALIYNSIAEGLMKNSSSGGLSWTETLLRTKNDVANCAFQQAEEFCRGNAIKCIPLGKARSYPISRHSPLVVEHGLSQMHGELVYGSASFIGITTRDYDKAAANGLSVNEVNTKLEQINALFD